MTSPDFKIVQQLSDRYFKVQKNDSFGVINNLGTLIIPFDIGDIFMFTDDTFRVETGWRSRDKYGYEDKSDVTYVVVDTNNRKLMPYDDYSLIEPFDEKTGLAKVERNKRTGFINKDFHEIIPCDYIAESLYSSSIYTEFNEGVCCLKKAANEFHYLNTNGEAFLQVEYFLALNFFESLAAVNDIFRGWGFIDKNGKEIIECQYDEVYSFSNGLAAVKDKSGHYNNRLWGFIDKENNLVIQFEYDEVQPFRNGFAIVRKGSNYGVIDRQGKEVIPLIYAFIDGNETEPIHPFSYIHFDNTSYVIGTFKIYITNTKIPKYS